MKKRKEEKDKADRLTCEEAKKKANKKRVSAAFKLLLGSPLI